MLRFVKWLTVGLQFIALWIVLLFSTTYISPLAPWITHIKLLPVYGLLSFGVYSAFVVLWRVYKFNNCEEAANELFEDIAEARKSLINRGYGFTEM